MKIALIGPKHVGKSAVGMILAQHWNIHFIDSDTLLIAHAHAQDGIEYDSARAVYDNIGGDCFQIYEEQVFSDIQQKESNYVLATGGGIADNIRIWAYLCDVKKVLLIDTIDRVWNRVLESGIPAFIKKDTDNHISKDEYYQRFCEIFNRRMEVYHQHADEYIHANQCNVEQIAHKIIVCHNQ